MTAITNYSINKTALMLIDMQNDFIHPDGAYGRAGQKSSAIAALPGKLTSLTRVFRKAGGLVVSTQFTLVPMRNGEPFIADHLRELRPFLKRGDFLPGGWGQQLLDELGPADISVEKVAYSAFYMSRLEFALSKAGISNLLFAGIVTNGGVASTLRDAHVRGFDCTVISDGCASFSDERHGVALADMASIASMLSIEEAKCHFAKD